MGGWAWFGDASDIKYQDLLHCDIRTVDVGTEQGAKPYAFALPKDSPLKERMNYEINKLRQEGFIEHLKWKWWEQNPKRVLGCKEDEDITGAVPIEKAWFTYKERQDKNRVKSIAVTEANGDSKMDS